MAPEARIPSWFSWLYCTIAPLYHHGVHGYIVPWPLNTIMVFMVISYHGPSVPSWCSWLYHTMAQVYHHGVHSFRYIILLLWPSKPVLQSRNYLFSAPAPAPVPALYWYLKWEIFVFQQHKNYIYYKSNIIKGMYF